MSTRIRTSILLLVLVLLAGLYFYSGPSFIRTRGPELSTVAVDKSGSLPLDEETRAKIRHYFEGIKLEPKENDLNFAINLDHSVGRVQSSQGKHKDAYKTYQKILAISYRQGSLMGIGIALMMLADISARADDIPESLYTTLLAYKIAQAMNNKEEAGVAELALAERLKKEDPSLSRMWLLRAKESLKDTRYKEDYVRFLVKLPSDLCCTGDPTRAVKVHGEAWESAQALGDSPTQKWTKWEAGTVYADDLMWQKQHEEAGRVLQKTLSFFSPAERNNENYTSVLHRLARVYSAQKKHAEARRYYLSAYANYELTRANAPGEQARAKLDKDNKGVVDDFVDYYLQSKDYAAALALLETNKARTLNDIMEGPSQKQVYGQWKEMESRHAREVMDLLQGEKDELSPLKGSDDVSKFIALLKKQNEERRKLQADLNLQDITVTRSLSKEQVEDIKRRLSPDVAVLSFFMRAERASVFLVTQNGIQHISLSLGAREYRRALQQLRVALTNPHNDFYLEPARLLFSKLLAPALTALPKTVKILVYSPDGILSRIPLAALMDGDRFVGERYAVYSVLSLRYATSIAGVKTTPVKSGIACVDPDVPNARLPFQQETGQALKKLYGEGLTFLAGKECAENKLIDAIKKLRTPTFLHIGAHGNFYPDNAMDSAILLSGEEGSSARGQVWNAKAMATVDMSRLDLITLSSCETGLTDPKTERDIFGLARALFFAGAKSIVAPLWAVHDQATAEYMQAFHRAYAQNIPAVVSLQQAQTALMKTEKYRHPYYWSAFVLTGAVR